MKQKRNLPLKTPLLTVARVSGALSALPLLAGAQESIVIEGSPDPVRVSDQNAKPEQRNPTDIRGVGQREQPSLDTIDVRKAKKLDELRDEIGISNSATQSEVTFTAEYLFDGDTSEVRKAADSTLQKLAEYIRLSNFETVSLNYLFAPSDEPEAKARERGAALSNYLDKLTKQSPTDFVLLDPQVVTEPVHRDGKPGQILEAYKSLVVLSMR